VKSVGPQNSQEQHPTLASRSAQARSGVRKNAHSQCIEDDGRKPQEKLLATREPQPEVKNQVVKRGMFVLAGAVKKEPYGVKERPSSEIHDSAFIVDRCEPAIREGQRRNDCKKSGYIEGVLSMFFGWGWRRRSHQSNDKRSNDAMQSFAPSRIHASCRGQCSIL
jgi:hypothetical protein